MQTRPARSEDAAAIARIYNQGIEDRMATFETEPRTPEAMAERLAAAQLPVVVVEADGQLLGWAMVSAYSARPCYAGVGDVSVYVERAARGRGVGRAVLEAVVAACEARGFWKLLSRIFVDNQASRAMCARAGFHEVGIHRRHARLDGQWRDCVVIERLLGDAARD